MGDHFLDSVSGMKELKIFKADEMQHHKMNESSEEFRKITMKVLVMQLASTTIMDLIAYGLETHHPAAYALIFILLYPPVCVIGWWAIDTFKDWWTKRK